MRERDPIADAWDDYYEAHPEETNHHDYRHTRPAPDGGGRALVIEPPSVAPLAALSPSRSFNHRKRPRL